MWKVSRYNIIGTKTWHYCQNCMKSKEEVLREIDTDACSYGIVGIDSRMGFKKKDNTKCREAVRRARKILENKNSSI